jgi:hypothetical protein
MLPYAHAVPIAIGTAFLEAIAPVRREVENYQFLDRDQELILLDVFPEQQ